jgi:hypothetical protein
MTLPNKTWRTLLPAALVLAAFTGAATAQVTPEQQSAIRANCRGDFTSKCSGVTPGGKDALVCLQTNVASLSPGCKTAVSATIPAPAPAATPPRPSQAQTPPPAPPPAAASTAPAPAAGPATAPPPAAAATTVRQVAPKPAQLAKPAAPTKQAAVLPSAAPIAAPAAAPPAAAAPAPTDEQMKAIKFTCRREFANNCRGVAPGGVEAINCLMGNAAKLTPDCSTSLAALGDAMPPAAGIPAPVATHTPNAPVAMTAVIGRACARDLIMHCSHVKVGDGRKIACLTERGPALAVMCQAALKITAPVR